MRALLVVTLLLTVGCATTMNAPLPPPPPPDAPLEERDAYYEEMKPLAVVGQPNYVNNLGWAVQPRFPALQLANGRRVSDVNELAPVVGADSLSAQAARKAGELKVLTNAMYTGGVVVLMLGVSALVVSPGFAGLGGAAFPTALLGATVFSAAGAVLLGIATELAEDAEAEKMSAFLLYDADLRRRLSLVRPDELLENKWVRDSSGAPPRAKPRARPAPPPSSSRSPGDPDPAPPPPPPDDDDPSAPPPPLGDMP